MVSTELIPDPGPFSCGWHGGRVLCPDGRVRSLKRIGTPDTFYSVPAAVSYRGRTVSGWVTTDDRAGRPVYVFCASGRHRLTFTPSDKRAAWRNTWRRHRCRSIASIGAVDSHGSPIGCGDDGMAEWLKANAHRRDYFASRARTFEYFRDRPLTPAQRLRVIYREIGPFRRDR